MWRSAVFVGCFVLMLWLLRLYVSQVTFLVLSISLLMWRAWSIMHDIVETFAGAEHHNYRRVTHNSETMWCNPFVCCHYRRRRRRQEDEIESRLNTTTPTSRSSWQHSQPSITISNPLHHTTISLTTTRQCKVRIPPIRIYHPKAASSANDQQIRDISLSLLYVSRSCLKDWDIL